MKAETLRQIENIDKSLRWVRDYRPEHYDQRFLELVGQRRRLRRIAAALHEKPAIAAYGESQKGKSYLIGNLLQRQKRPFNVVNEDGGRVNFVDRINPIGDRKEATGVVTRFTPFNTGDAGGRYRSDHPVIVKTFSVGNLATILCDSYFNDLLNKNYYADADIKEIAENIYNHYRTLPEQPQSVLTEDDILDIKAYLARNVKDAQNILRSGYFEKLALVVRRVPQSEWPSVLKYLWHENEAVTRLFRRLVDALGRLNFAPEVYVDFQAVMHLGDNRNTIMSVDCLNGLDDPAWSLTTDVYVRETPGGGLTVVAGFPKCELCALCAETIFKIEPEYLSDSDSFYCDTAAAGLPGHMTAPTMAKLPAQVKKQLLADTDLLDFPGARNRLKVMEEFLERVDADAGASNLVQMLLRGKVAFLFNHYSESRMINILLFCHDSDQPNVNEMYSMINDWVVKYVGGDPATRRLTVDRCGGVSPLFVVGTKFNMDMIEKGKTDGDSEAALNGRWFGRFMKVLYTQSFKAESMEWFNNWDARGATFKNTYMLRDYKYSGCDGSGNNLYEGYTEADPNPRETSLHLSGEFYDRLRRTFVDNPDVRKFFADPALAWDVAATMNNDGALYIIDRLAVVARNMATTRNAQFAAELSEITNRVEAIMATYRVSDSEAEILQDNIRRARAIFRELEFTCQSQPEYFGHLLQALQLSETESFNEIHRLLPVLNTMVSDTTHIKDYELIRKRCRNFEGCTTEHDYWMRMAECYYFSSRDEAAEYLRIKGIDSAKLFAPPAVRRTNSAVISNMLVDRWRRNISGVEFVNRFGGDNNVDEIALSGLVDCILFTAGSVGLAARIEAEISDYVDMLNTLAINEDLVADIIATRISDFVNDFGFSYLTESQIDTARRTAANNRVECFDWTGRERKEHYDDAELTAMFNDILSSSEHFTPAYEANYNRWLEYMNIAFIAHVRVSPDYNKEANDELKAILAAVKS